MLKAKIPADGHWHDLPHKPVTHIDAPTYAGIMIDIMPDGTGRVRAPDWDGEEIEVHYTRGRRPA